MKLYFYKQRSKSVRQQMMKPLYPAPYTSAWRQRRGHRWVVFCPDCSKRRFRSKRKAFKWAEHEAKRVGGWVRNFHKMTSKQRKAYWRKVSEVAE